LITNPGKMIVAEQEKRIYEQEKNWLTVEFSRHSAQSSRKIYLMAALHNQLKV
jgi:hypothetical protein